MRKKLIFWMFSLFALQYSGALSAQEKFEKESRIREKEVPAKALQFVYSAGLHDKIKWYSEEGLNKKSIEAKLKHNWLKYSIEFDTLGNVEDVEKEISWEELDSQFKNLATQHLEQHYSKHSVVKVQRQYLGSEAALISIIRENKRIQPLTVNYELIVKCNQQTKVGLFEYLFDEAGNLLSFSKIVFKNSSHLEF